ncbi:molybdopterin oxidoreductase family protein [Natrinema soli]|uniref:Molybdopterin oxidoreductase family protein n=1 Tax=Natrinema soli TaxID=1930624 RepID=A0ABD5SPC9_9EURY|nr:molybdopterin-dependent oxidoreductase [Natrinema soli]
MPDQTPDDSKTICPLCGVGCRLKPGVDETHARGVAGSANPNGRLCRKGISAFDSTDDDRLTNPLIRQNGDLQSVSWATAYDHIVERFEAILDTYGSDALAFLGAPHCTNEENYLLQKLARMLGTNNVDNRARLCHVSTTRILTDRIGWPATTNSLAELLDADVIIVAGANPAERQPIAFNSFIRPAVNEGATLVHIDPVGNRTTRLADRHVKPRPGMDALVFDLLSSKIVANETGVDRTFVDNRTRGFDRFETSITDIKYGETLSVSGVAEESIEAVSDYLTDADRVAALVGTGIERSSGETKAPEALLNLLLLTGNIGCHGAGLYVLRGLANEQGATDAGCVPDRLPGHQPVTDPRARARIASEWGIDPPSSPGKTAKELLASFGSDVHGALAVGENPAISKRDPDWVRQRLNALDVLVVVDLVPNETTRHADVVLPASTGTEKAGTFTNLERRIQRIQRTRTPPEQARSDFTILTDLGMQLTERPNEFEYSRVSEVFDELSRVAPTHAGLSHSEIGRVGCQWPLDDDGFLYRETFETVDGRAQFGSVQPLVERGPDNGFRLVTGGRKSNSHNDKYTADRTLRINPTDADERGITADEGIVVSSEDISIQTTAKHDDSIRQGTVYLPADVADPFLRREAATVSLTSSPR